jgi:hypothetical protein
MTEFGLDRSEEIPTQFGLPSQESYPTPYPAKDYLTEKAKEEIEKGIKITRKKSV